MTKIGGNQMRNCLVAQSGGPTVAINASLAGVIQGTIDSKQFNKIYGSLNGVQGLLNGRLMDLSQKVEEIPMFIGVFLPFLPYSLM